MKKTILFIENGRIGNQLFQYQGIRTFFGGHRLVLIGFRELERTVHVEGVCVYNQHVLLDIIPFGVLRRFARLISWLGFVGSIVEDSTKPDYSLAEKRGFFSRLYVAHDLFFQHRDVIEAISDPPVLKLELKEQAKQWVERQGFDEMRKLPVFVHVRRGDYQAWPSRRAPAVLDPAWYERMIRLVREKVQNPIFICLSDDPAHVREVFGASESMILSENSPEIDLAIMSYCAAGILSPSSFAWWGAYYARKRLADSALFIAPTFWIGHRTGTWYPSFFKSSWITYVEGASGQTEITKPNLPCPS